MLSTAIKTATQESHQKLEKKVVKKLKAVRSNADYAELLKYFYAYFNKLENKIAPFITADVLPDHKNRRTSAYLKADIEQLGQSVNELPAVTVPQIHNVIQALGALYVMEGSIMGGPYIVQMLAKGGINSGVSFFSGYGPATGQKWQAFTAVLNAHAPTLEAEEVAILTANETFRHFSEAFDAQVPEVTEKTA